MKSPALSDEAGVASLLASRAGGAVCSIAGHLLGWTGMLLLEEKVSGLVSAGGSTGEPITLSAVRW